MLTDKLAVDVLMCVPPGFASNENLAGIHDTTGQASRVDGAQGGAQLDYVGPDQRFREEACMLPWGWRLMLSWRKQSSQ